MEKKSFNWFLYQLAQRQISINLLEVGFCKRDKVTDWYCLNQFGQVFRNKLSSSNFVKSLLSFFLSKRSQKFDEYNPDKFICYAYHRTGRKIIASKEAREMVNHQMHGLEISSLHISLQGVDDSLIYRVICDSKKNELHLEIEIRRFDKEKGTQVKDQPVSDKIVSFVMNLCDIIGRLSKSLIYMVLDLVISKNLTVFLLNIDELTFRVENLEASKEIQKVSSFRVGDDDSSSISDDEALDKESKKKESSKIKVPLAKPAVNNSPIFLEMIAKTIEKNRKKQYSYRGKEFMTVDERELRASRQVDTENRTDSLFDLLNYLEKTRPKVWIRDISISARALGVKVTPSRKASIDNILPEIERKLAQKNMNENNEGKMSREYCKSITFKPKSLHHGRSVSDSNLPVIKR